MKRERIESLQVVRALAFMAVLFTHCGIIPNLGGWGVSVFIVLSGFLMAYSYSDRIEYMDISVKGNALFAISKMKRLYPLHIIMMLAAIMISVVKIHLGLSTVTVLELIRQIILQITLLQTLIPVSKNYYMALNGLSWYLSVSMILYFFFPWILKRIKKLASKQLVVESVVLYVFIFIVTSIDQLLFAENEDLLTYYNYVWPLLRLCDFTIGCNFGVIFLKNRGKLRTAAASWLELVTFLLVGISIWFLNSNHDTLIGRILAHSTFLYAPTSVALVYLFSERKGIISRSLTNKVLVYIGDISPYGYLIHGEVIAYVYVLITRILNKPADIRIITLLTVCITWGAMYVYIWFENNILTRKRKE